MLSFLGILGLLSLPGIAARVRSLSLSPDMAHTIIEAPLRVPKVMRKWMSLYEIYGVTKNQTTSLLIRLLHGSPAQEARSFVIADVAKRLINVTNLSICGSATGGSCLLLTTLLPVISSRLHSLSFDVTVPAFDRILSTPDFLHLQSLRHITISLHPEFPCFGPGSAVVSFLRSLPCSLECLSFEAHGIHDERGIVPHLPSYLGSFGEYPNLTKLSLVVPLDHGTPSASALNHIIRKHASSLTDLTLVGTPCSSCVPLPLHWPAGVWRTACLRDVTFTRLQSLTLQMHLIFKCPPPFARSLRTLSLPGQSLCSGQYTAAFSYLATQDCIEDLELTVTKFDAPLLLGLAGCTPRLRRLVLRERRPPFAPPTCSVPVDFIPSPRAFPPPGHEALFAAWPLADVAVWVWSFK
ncbi:hypothetical protein DXG01_009791 [Tephrocybe rancida]|nr:hypothetical protein DXG01_009791 [Tephrocybe rancida]